MMTTTEILNEIYRLPKDQQEDIRSKILKDSALKRQPKKQMTQDEFDQILFDDGILASFPVEPRFSGQ